MIYLHTLKGKPLNVTNLAGMQMVDRLMIAELKTQVEELQADLCKLGVSKYC